jgi:hypothetical protein
MLPCVPYVASQGGGTMKGAPFLISLIVLLALLSPCVHAQNAPESTEEGSLSILSSIAKGLGLISGIFMCIGGISIGIGGISIGIATIFAGLSLLIISIPVTVPLSIIASLIGMIAFLIGAITFLIGGSLAFVAFVLYVLLILGSISPRVASLLNRIITPMIDFYHRIEKWAIS